MTLTSIADQKTPGRPIQVTFAPNTALPSANQEVCLIGHMAASGAGGSGSMSATGGGVLYNVQNAADPVAALAEVGALFGSASELAKMVVAAVQANSLIGGSNFPALKVIPLYSTDTDFGTALTTLAKVKAEFVASCYDAQTSQTNFQALITQCQSMSGAQSVENNQFGSFAVGASFSTGAASALKKYDSQYAICVWKRDSAPTRTVAEMAACAAASLAANAVPFNPVDSIVLGGAVAPASVNDNLTIGAGLESETALNQGWCPLRVLPNGSVAWVRAVTTRVTSDGSTAVTAYYDVMDFQVLYFWRKTLWTRLNQPDLKQAKASQDTAKLILSEALRLANSFQDQAMFQQVAKLAPQFQVARSASDRHRFDVLTPVNVIPGLHDVMVNVQAGTQFDSFSI